MRRTLGNSGHVLPMRRPNRIRGIGHQQAINYYPSVGTAADGLFKVQSWELPAVRILIFGWQPAVSSPDTAQANLRGTRLM